MSRFDLSDLLVVVGLAISGFVLWQYDPRLVLLLFGVTLLYVGIRGST